MVSNTEQWRGVRDPHVRIRIEIMKAGSEWINAVPKSWDLKASIPSRCVGKSAAGVGFRIALAAPFLDLSGHISQPIRRGAQVSPDPNSQVVLRPHFGSIGPFCDLINETTPFWLLSGNGAGCFSEPLRSFWFPRTQE